MLKFNFGDTVRPTRPLPDFKRPEKVIDFRLSTVGERQYAVVNGHPDNVAVRWYSERDLEQTVSQAPCGYRDCQGLVSKYGDPGTSLSRFDNKTLICSDCGVAEAMGKAHYFLRSYKPKRFVSLSK